MPKGLTGKTRLQRSIALISTTIVAIFGTLAALIGFAGRESFAPRAIDQLFGISTYVGNTINKRVDSGYSHTFIFRPTKDDSARNNNDTELLFDAGKKQFVYLTVLSIKNGSRDLKYRIMVDGADFREVTAEKDQFQEIDITGKLKPDRNPYHIHELKVLPKDIKVGEVLVVRCLVLVSNTDRQPD